MSERVKVEHPSWCSQLVCTAPEYRPETGGEDRFGEHLSVVTVLPGVGMGRELRVFLSQSVAPWGTGTFLRLETGDGNNWWTTEVGEVGEGFRLFELLAQSVGAQTREFPTLYGKRFGYVAEATAPAAKEDQAAEDEPDEVPPIRICGAPFRGNVDRPCTLPPGHGYHVHQTATGVQWPRAADDDQAATEVPEPHEDSTLPPQLRAALKKMGERGKVVELTSSTPMPGMCQLTLNHRVRLRGTFQEVRACVAELVTTSLAGSPVGLAEEAQTLNLAFTGGSVEAVIDEGGEWSTTYGTSTGNPTRIAVTREA